MNADVVSISSKQGEQDRLARGGLHMPDDRSSGSGVSCAHFAPRTPAELTKKICAFEEEDTGWEVWTYER